MANKFLSGTEKTISSLCALYAKRGFKQYRMSKFEQYDLYAKNKDFLISENVITFTDTDGKLMALKPDVTLSIIKNGKDGDGVSKVYYNEHVYRVSKGTGSFKEFTQVGLECFGALDDYALSEVIFLAAKSLESVSKDYVLDLSHLGIVNGVLDALKISASGKNKIIEYLGEKNAHGALSVCQEENVSEENAELLIKLITVYGSQDKVLPVLDELNIDENTDCAIKQLKNILSALSALGVGDNINIDFSVVSDVNYYNGLVFKGFISGIPVGIISGGQYDNLMQKFKRRDRAIGFAVYLDELENLLSVTPEYDVDVLVEYGSVTDIALINKIVKQINDGGESAFACVTAPENLKYKRKVCLTEEN